MDHAFRHQAEAENTTVLTRSTRDKRAYLSIDLCFDLSQ